MEMDHLIHDFFLENHVIRRREIISASACEVSCYMAADCVSYNLRQPQDPDGGYLCELNNSTNEIHPFDVKYEKELSINHSRYDGNLNSIIISFVRSQYCDCFSDIIY